MKKICAWCKKDMGTTLGPENMTTHGICPACANTLRQDLKTSISASPLKQSKRSR